jgi:DNA-binding protein H-NS
MSLLPTFHLPKENYRMKGTKIDTQIAKLEQQIEAERAKFKAAVFNAVGTVLASYGLSLEDLVPTKKAEKKAAPEKATKAKKKITVTVKGTRPPKYRDPESGKTWSGMGHTPQWMVNAKNRDAFLIN